MDGAREALMDLPPRSEPELDPVTLHNLALTDTSGGIGTSLRRLGVCFWFNNVISYNFFSFVFLLTVSFSIFT